MRIVKTYNMLLKRSDSFSKRMKLATADEIQCILNSECSFMINLKLSVLGSS